jgi:hypothetical protein
MLMGWRRGLAPTRTAEFRAVAKDSRNPFHYTNAAPQPEFWRVVVMQHSVRNELHATCHLTHG